MSITFSFLSQFLKCVYFKSLRLSFTTSLFISFGVLSLIACDDHIDNSSLSQRFDFSREFQDADSLTDRGSDQETLNADDFGLPYDQNIQLDIEFEDPVDQSLALDAMVNNQLDQSVLDALDMGIPTDRALPPSLEHLDTVVELAAPGQQVWAQVIHVAHDSDQPLFTARDYSPTAQQVDFWPASTIKMYTATAMLELISRAGFSLDATLGFQRRIDEQWVEELNISVREVVRRTFDCSSNETYTLLLRFAGVDWLNTEFFTPINGFHQTALMRDYVADEARPWSYQLLEAQRISISEGSRQVIREHQWSGRSYANERGCIVYNNQGDANCTSAGDMAEHMRRVIFHEKLPIDQRFEISESLLTWYRGESGEFVLNNTQGDYCGGPVYTGIQKVFDQPILHHKEGLVSEYRGTIHHVYDEDTNTEYVASIMLDQTSEVLIEKISEELARMMKTPSVYVHLGYLRDYVNPITADLVTYSERPGILQLMVKPYEEDGFNLEGWSVLQGSHTPIESGEHSHTLRSQCLSESGQLHIRGRLETEAGVIAWSDLHYVIVDHTQACP